ncbi:hypothetical protein [Streptomyces globisporus]|uniref:hypothetical protein n=1 Tax=Streptomyces globisporus TaxID=1908 RepID=UPI0036CBDEE2
MNETEQKYRVATYSYACTAYVRSTLRRALELQSTQNVWTGTDYINTARSLVSLSKLPDEQTWELTKLELQTIYKAIAWRRARRSSGETDRNTSLAIEAEWSHIEDEIFRVLREVWHSEGKYWM